MSVSELIAIWDQEYKIYNFDLFCGYFFYVLLFGVRLRDIR